MPAPMRTLPPIWTLQAIDWIVTRKNHVFSLLFFHSVGQR
jgi:hypothetical protein